MIKEKLIPPPPKPPQPRRVQDSTIPPKNKPPYLQYRTGMKVQSKGNNVFKSIDRMLYLILIRIVLLLAYSCTLAVILLPAVLIYKYTNWSWAILFMITVPISYTLVRMLTSLNASDLEFLIESDRPDEDD